METIYLLSYSGYAPDSIPTGIIAAFEDEEEAIRVKNHEEACEEKSYSARIAQGHTPPRVFYHVRPIDLISKKKFVAKDHAIDDQLSTQYHQFATSA